MRTDTVLTAWNPDCLPLHVQLARIAIEPATVQERAEAVLAVLGQVLPYDAVIALETPNLTAATVRAVRTGLRIPHSWPRPPERRSGCSSQTSKRSPFGMARPRVSWRGPWWQDILVGIGNLRRLPVRIVEQRCAIETVPRGARPCKGAWSAHRSGSDRSGGSHRHHSCRGHPGHRLPGATVASGLGSVAAIQVAAIQDAAAQRRPLPRSPAGATPVPFEYLLRLGSAISART
ncbi:MAG: hypothetical protein JWR70_541 [Modestobacter sp.]|jgi:hypothetical protein|nr:hypothetical protein [Modestobacter sp.]